MSAQRPPPPWVKWALAQAHAQIVGDMGPAMLPRSEHVLGCGVFGCAMLTEDPAWVCKVTLDGSEAFFASALESFEPMAGICRYLTPIRVDSPPGPIWILWRSAVEMPELERVAGQLGIGRPDYIEMRWSKLDELQESGIPKAQVERLWKQWTDEVDAMQAADDHARGLDVYPILQAMTQAGLSVAAELGRWQKSGRSIESFCLEVSSLARKLMPRFKPASDHLNYWRYGDREDDPRMEKAAFRLIGYGYQLGRLQDTTIVPEMARSLRALYDRGIMMADLNADNIARLDGVWTLYDGGFCVPTYPAWSRLWRKVSASSLPWFDQDRWEPFMGLQPNPVADLCSPGLLVGGTLTQLRQAEQIARDQGLDARRDGSRLRMGGFPSRHDAAQFAGWLNSQGFKATVEPASAREPAR